MSVELIVLERCESTQDEVRARLGGSTDIVAVRSRSQGAGRGRDGRGWQDPPGAALLLSVGTGRELDARRLAGLPRRVADALAQRVAQLGGFGVEQVAWKAPNDLLVAASGAKLAGILVDVRTMGTSVQELIVGVGVNLAGGAFTTTVDGRAAGTVEAMAGHSLDLDDAGVSAFARLVASDIAELL